MKMILYDQNKKKYCFYLILSLAASKNSYKFQPKNYRREKMFHINVLQVPQLVSKKNVFKVLPPLDPTETDQWLPLHTRPVLRQGNWLQQHMSTEHHNSKSLAELCLPAGDSMTSSSFLKTPELPADSIKTLCKLGSCFSFPDSLGFSKAKKGNKVSQKIICENMYS